MIEYKIIDVDTAVAYWKMYLWKDASVIRPVSSMTYELEYNMSVYDFEYSKPSYIGAYDEERLVGINSGHIVYPNTEYRSRGLYVNPNYRGHGIGQTLLTMTIERSKQADCEFSWSLPRKSSLRTYESVGFVKTSDWITETVEFGPNCYVYIKN